jgi:hypothetical protein
VVTYEMGNIAGRPAQKISRDSQGSSLWQFPMGARSYHGLGLPDTVDRGPREYLATAGSLFGPWGARAASGL